MKLRYFTTLILCFILGMGMVLGLRYFQVKQADSRPFIPDKVTFKLKPPSQALEGNLNLIKGVVLKQGRGEKDFTAVRVDSKIVDGESIKTEADGSVSVEFPQFGTMTLESSSEILLTNTRPQNFLATQQSGAVVHRFKNSKGSYSVRLFHSLFELDANSAAQVIVDMNKKTATITLKEGSGILGMIDLSNATRVWTAKEGSTIAIDDDTRTALSLSKTN